MKLDIVEESTALYEQNKDDPREFTVKLSYVEIQCAITSCKTCEDMLDGWAAELNRAVVHKLREARDRREAN